MKELFADKLAGIPLYAWQRFLALFTESRSAEDVARDLDRMAAALVAKNDPKPSDEAAQELRAKFREIIGILANQGAS